MTSRPSLTLCSSNRTPKLKTNMVRPQIALALRARAILLVFEKIYSCLFIPNCTRNHVPINKFDLYAVHKTSI